MSRDYTTSLRRCTSVSTIGESHIDSCSNEHSLEAPYTSSNTEYSSPGVRPVRPQMNRFHTYTTGFAYDPAPIPKHLKWPARTSQGPTPLNVSSADLFQLRKITPIGGGITARLLNLLQSQVLLRRRRRLLPFCTCQVISTDLSLYVLIVHRVKQTASLLQTGGIGDYRLSSSSSHSRYGFSAIAYDHAGAKFYPFLS